MKSEPAILLDKGVTAFQNKQTDSAVFYWNLILTKFKDSTFYYGRAMNNTAVAYEASGQLEKAKAAYIAILNSDLNDKEDNNDLMEPYTNYRHNACMRMSRMFSGAGQFREALHWVDKAEKEYKYETFSGTSYEKRMVSIATWRSNYYTELGQPDSAIYALVFKIFDTDVSVKLPDMQSFTNVDFYSRISNTVLPMIEKQYTKARFKEALDKALESLTITKEKDLTVCSFTLFGLNYRLPTDNKDADAKTFVNRIQSSSLYKVLQESGK